MKDRRASRASTAQARTADPLRFNSADRRYHDLRSLSCLDAMIAAVGCPLWAHPRDGSPFAQQIP